MFVAMMIGVGMALFWNKRQIILDRLAQTSARRVVFFDSLTDLLGHASQLSTQPPLSVHRNLGHSIDRRERSPLLAFSLAR